jgi:hypothetical protein
MSRFKTIGYMIDDEGLVYSRVGSEVAIPVLEFDKMTPKNGYKTSYHLEKFNVLDLIGCGDLIHTRKIPTEIKNQHRRFWGMKPLNIS